MKKQLIEGRIKKKVKEIINEYEYNIWGDKPLQNTRKEDEIESSWKAYKETMGDEKGNIPTELSDIDSWERMKYNRYKQDKEESMEDIEDDYPNAFTLDDEDLPGYKAMQCMSNNPLDSQYHKQHWSGRTDKNGKPIYHVDFNKVVENIIKRIKNNYIK